jgi:hypothetical protein
VIALSLPLYCSARACCSSWEACRVTPTDRCGRRAWAPGTSGLGQGRRGRTVERSRCYTPCRMLPPPTLQTRQPKEAGHTVTLTQSPVRSHAAPRERQRAWHVRTGECPSHAAPRERSESGSGHSQPIIARVAWRRRGGRASLPAVQVAVGRRKQAAVERRCQLARVCKLALRVDVGRRGRAAVGRRFEPTGKSHRARAAACWWSAMSEQHVERRGVRATRARHGRVARGPELDDRIIKLMHMLMSKVDW